MGSFTASLELSRTLFELSGWDKTYWYYDGKKVVIRAGFIDNFIQAPAYDLGYLIRKLPPDTAIINQGRLFKDSKPYLAVRRTYTSDPLTHIGCEADTPENALCKLAIELYKQGILTKNNQEQQS